MGTQRPFVKGSTAVLILQDSIGAKLRVQYSSIGGLLVFKATNRGLTGGGRRTRNLTKFIRRFRWKELFSAARLRSKVAARVACGRLWPVGVRRSEAVR